MRLIDVTLEDLREVVREELERALADQGAARDDPERILSTREAAEIADRSPETIIEWIKAGRLRALPRRPREHWRIRASDLRAALEGPQAEGVDADQWAQGILRRVV